MSPAELIFTRKIKSVFNKILPEWKVWTSRNFFINEYLNLGEKVFFMIYLKGKRILERWCGLKKKKKKNQPYDLHSSGTKVEVCHLNQLRCNYIDLENFRQEIPMAVLYGTFDVPMSQENIELLWYGKRKRTTMESVSVEPTLKRYKLQRKPPQKGLCYIRRMCQYWPVFSNTDIQAANNSWNGLLSWERGGV